MRVDEVEACLLVAAGSWSEVTHIFCSVLFCNFYIR
jgi:hypothetical protein